MKKNKTTAWADGYGIWHCRVDIGYPAPCDAINMSGIRSIALRKIRRAIDARLPQHVAGKYRLRLIVEANELGADNRLYSITLKESE